MLGWEKITQNNETVIKFHTEIKTAIKMLNNFSCEDNNLEDFYLFSNSTRNLILKGNGYIIKIYESYHHIKKEVMVMNNISRRNISNENILIFEELPNLKTEGFDSVERILTFSKLLKEFWTENENLLNDELIVARQLGKEREENLIECFGDYSDSIMKIVRNWEKGPLSKIVFCHGDLGRGNIMIKGKEMNLIDFEFSGKNEMFLDLASFIVENELPKSKVEILAEIFEIKDLDNFILFVNFFTIRTCIDWFIRYKKKGDLDLYNGYLRKKEKVIELLK